MKYLREIVQIVTKFRESKVEIVDDTTTINSEDNVAKLFLGIKNGSITTDQKAAELIYGSTFLDTKYTSLKNRLKKGLLNSIFFLDIRTPEYAEQTVAFYKVNRDTFVVKVLARLGARNSAIKKAESSLKNSQKFHLTPNTIEFLLSLRNYSSTFGNEKDYDRYDALLKTALKTYEAECVAQEYNDRLILKFAKSSADQPEMKGIVEEWCKELDVLRRKYDSFNLSYNYLRLQSQSYQISQEYRSSVNICTEAEGYLAANPHLSNPTRVGEFALQKLICYLNLREYENGKEAASKCASAYPEGSNNWFIFMELHVYLLMHTEHFKEAESVYNEVTQHPRYVFQPEHKKESWRLLELYLRFALGSESTDATQEAKTPAMFDLKKFLRAVPSYTGDKRGYNVAILILQILYLLDNNDFSNIISRMDALRTYRTRYLRVSSNKQSALFFKMLQIMETNSFSYEITKQKAQKYYDRILSTTAESSEIQDGPQVLPFDWLWRKILEMLKQKEEQGIIQKVIK